MYYFRLDDAATKMNAENWLRIETLFNKYDLKPLVGVIPACQDKDFEHYPFNPDFWTDIIARWKENGWVLGMHGFSHVFETENPGINPVNKYSEFAGVPESRQRDKIREGIHILRSHGINPSVFIAPAHTFDLTTVRVLLEESDIRFISDMPANKPFKENGMVFLPQQSGRVRALPFAFTTFCYHPNNMSDKDFEELEAFIVKYRDKCRSYCFSDVNRKKSLYDRILMNLYWWRHK